MAETVQEHEHHINLAHNVVMRDREVYQYQVNIDNYTLMLAALPQDDWPADLFPYKDTAPESFPETLTDAQVQLISDYQYRDRLRKLLRTERIEQGKAQRVKDALKAQIPAAEYDQLIADATVAANQLI